MLSTAFSTVPKPVITSTGRALLRRRTSFRNVRPSIFGIFMSVTTMPKRVRCSRAMASSPLSQTTAW